MEVYLQRSSRLLLIECAPESTDPSRPFICFFIILSVTLSLSQARIVPSALARRHAHSYRALRQPVTLRLHPAPAAPRLTELRTGRPFSALRRELSETPENYMIDAVWDTQFGGEKIVPKAQHTCCVGTSVSSSRSALGGSDALIPP